MKRMAKAQVLKLVGEQLDKVKLDGVKLRLFNEKIQKRDDCWYIPVRASGEPSSMYLYYDALAEVETELGEKYDIDVWLIPTLPD